MTVSPDIMQVLTRGAWFARLDESLQRRLAEAGRVVALRGGQWVYSQGDARTGLCAVLDGALRIEVALNDERDVLIGLATPPTIMGQTRNHGGGPRIVTLRANVPSRVLMIADDVLASVAAVEPDLWRVVNELVYAQLEEITRLAARLLVQSPAARVAMRLLQFAEGDRVAVNQADLAEMTGLSRKTVNGHLAVLARSGAVALGYRAIDVLDRAALERIAGR